MHYILNFFVIFLLASSLKDFINGNKSVYCCNPISKRFGSNNERDKQFGLQTPGDFAPNHQKFMATTARSPDQRDSPNDEQYPSATLRNYYERDSPLNKLSNNIQSLEQNSNFRSNWPKLGFGRLKSENLIAHQTNLRNFTNVNPDSAQNEDTISINLPELQKLSIHSPKTGFLTQLFNDPKYKRPYLKFGYANIGHPFHFIHPKSSLYENYIGPKYPETLTSVIKPLKGDPIDIERLKQELLTNEILKQKILTEELINQELLQQLLLDEQLKRKADKRYPTQNKFLNQQFTNDDKIKQELVKKIMKDLKLESNNLNALETTNVFDFLESNDSGNEAIDIDALRMQTGKDEGKTDFDLRNMYKKRSGGKNNDKDKNDVKRKRKIVVRKKRGNPAKRDHFTAEGSSSSSKSVEPIFTYNKCLSGIFKLFCKTQRRVLGGLKTVIDRLYEMTEEKEVKKRKKQNCSIKISEDEEIRIEVSKPERKRKSRLLSNVSQTEVEKKEMTVKKVFYILRKSMKRKEFRTGFGGA